MTTNRLHLPATQVVAPDGAVRYAFLDSDYKIHAEPAEVARALERLDE